LTLVVRGDDFGLHGLNDLVTLACADTGRLRNVSVQANGPALSSSIENLAQRADVCVGLHATLTCEWQRGDVRPILPPSALPRLMRNGRLPPDGAALQRLDVPPDELLAEVQAQHNRLRSMGLEVAYVDVHMGIDHHLPVFRRMLRSWAEDVGLVAGDDLPRLPRVGSGSLREQVSLGLKQADPGTYLLVVHPGDIRSGADLVLADWPTLDVGQVRAEEATVVIDDLTATAGRRAVQFCRIDTLER
jgi:hypothetical protein